MEWDNLIHWKNDGDKDNEDKEQKLQKKRNWPCAVHVCFLSFHCSFVLIEFKVMFHKAQYYN